MPFPSGWFVRKLTSNRLPTNSRRLLGMSAGAPDDRALPLSLAAAARFNRSQALSTRRLRNVDSFGARRLKPRPHLHRFRWRPTAPQLAASASRSPTACSAPWSRRRSSLRRDPRRAPTLRRPHSRRHVRSIKLQLNPHSLGVVTIVLTASDGDLRVHLEAERAETFGKVEQERGTLSARLNGAGYAVTELTVGRMSAGDAPTREGDQREARQGSQAEAQMGGQQRNSAGSGARESAAQFAEQRAGRQPGDPASRATGALSTGRAGTIDQAVSGLSFTGRFRPV